MRQEEYIGIMCDNYLQVRGANGIQRDDASDIEVGVDCDRVSKNCRTGKAEEIPFS